MRGSQGIKAEEGVRVEFHPFRDKEKKILVSRLFATRHKGVNIKSFLLRD